MRLWEFKVIILSIHNGPIASAALLIDDKMIDTIQEERFTRIKNHAIFPEVFIKYLILQIM